MATTPPDPQPYRRSQQRRALIGWLGGLLAVAAVVLLIVAGSDDDRHPRAFHVEYGEEMTSADYAGIDLGEEAAEVLPRLAASGRPEVGVEPYVLVLFPPRQEGDECTYFEFSDEPEIFARLCFDESSGELVEKRKRDVHHPLRAEEGDGTVI